MNYKDKKVTIAEVEDMIEKIWEMSEKDDSQACFYMAVIEMLKEL